MLPNVAVPAIAVAMRKARGGGREGRGRGALAATKDAPEPRVHGRGAAGCVYMPPQRSPAADVEGNGST